MACCMLATWLLATGITAQTYVLPPPGGEGWRPLVFPRVEKQTQYERVEFEGASALRARARCSASGLVHAAPGLELSKTPWLHWRWRVDRDLPERDPRTKAGDDYAARVYVAFRFEPERASGYERVKRAALRLIYGEELPGSALNYVWSASEPVGSTWQSPYAERSRVLSLGAGPAGAWRAARVDLRADYRRVFDAEPPPVEFVALMSDADDGCGETLAWFADLRFASQ